MLGLVGYVCLLSPSGWKLRTYNLFFENFMKPKAIQNFVFFASYPSQESKPRGILKLDGEKDVCE